MKTNRLFGLAALVAAIALSMTALSLAGCDNGDGGGGGGNPELSGNITITPAGTVTIGTSLKADYDGDETIAYQWKRGNSNVGTNSDTYAPDTAGSYTVTVSAAGYKSKTSAPVTVIAPGDDVYTLSWGVWVPETYANVSSKFTAGGAPLTAAGTNAGYLTGSNAETALGVILTSFPFDDDGEETGTFENLVNFQQDGIGAPQALKTAILAQKANVPVGAVFQASIQGANAVIAFYIDKSGGGGNPTAPTITTTALPGGTVGTPYTATLAATGDTPITWSVESGTLPGGLSLSGNTISGTPTTPNTSNFTVKATNAVSSDTKQLSITIAPAGNGSSKETAIPLTVNRWEDGDLPTSSDVQWFTFTATASTQYIHAAFGTLTDLYVQVYDSGGATVGSETRLYGSTKYISRSSLTSGQTYYIRVRPYGSGTGGSSGNYRIAFNASTTPPVPPVELPSSGITTLTVNQWEDGNLSTSDSVQWFTFTATASNQYIHAAFGTLSFDSGINVQVYDSSGATVGSETNLYGTTTSTPRSSLTSGQTYYIRVRSYNLYNGTYQIGFGAIVPPGVITLTENQWTDGNLPTWMNVQWFTFTATASTQYIHVALGTQIASSGINVQVYDSSDATVGSETRLYASTTSTSRSSLTSGQTYYIRVRPYSGNSGTYRIGFNTSTTAPTTVQLPFNAIPLTESQWADGDLPTPDDRQWFTFTATASTQWIHALFNGTLFAGSGINVQVYDSGGATVENETRLYDNDGTATGTSRTLTIGDTYYIRVWTYGDNAGTYQIGFNTSSTSGAIIIKPPSNAIPLTVNQWANGNLPTSDSVQWFTFTATASTQYIHAAFGTLTYLYVQVYDSGGTAVESETRLYGTGASARTSRTLTSGQTYYIRVWLYYGSSSSGTYRIGFNTSTTAPTSP